jgi:hypothetical protein
MGTSAPTWRYINTATSPPTASSASSTVGLSGVTLPLLRMPSAVITSLAPASLILSARACAPKPENTTLWTAPILLTASIATMASGIIGM